MLATWGVSLVLMQAARVYFGDLTAVVAPGPLRGGAQVMVGVYLPYNRIFIIALSIVCVLGIYYTLFRSNLGLRVRAVTQNRNMSACLGIPTPKKLTPIPLRSDRGWRASRGWALTMVVEHRPRASARTTSSTPFMVVPFYRRSRKSWQARLWRSPRIGGLNKLIEPSFGAVYGKVFILVLVILFLQWRPSGLFAMKGTGCRLRMECRRESFRARRNSTMKGME